MVEEPKIVTQPHLGRAEDSYKPGSKMQGYMAIAKILNVHHKHCTADVQIVNTSDVFSCPTSLEGKYSPKILSSSGGFSVKTMTSWGTTEPIMEGQLVLLAFLDAARTKPIILGVLPDTEDSFKNILTTIYPLNQDNPQDKAEALKYLKVFPCQSYDKVDGDGGVEHSHSSKTFFKMGYDPYDVITDSHNGYDHKDLSELDQLIGKVREGRDEPSTFPLNILFCHRSNFDDAVSTCTKLFIGKTGMPRITRDNNDGTLSYQEISPEGKLISRRQIDSNTHGLGADYSESIIDIDGSISVIRHTSKGDSSYLISSSGEISINHNTGSFIRFDENGDIIIKASGRVHTIDGA